MIPAILSCVFVIYLYRKLKAENDTSHGRDVEASDDLAARIEALDERLERLAAKGGARS